MLTSYFCNLNNKPAEDILKVLWKTALSLTQTVMDIFIHIRQQLDLEASNMSGCTINTI